MKSEIKKVEVNGVTLAYEEYGSGEDYVISSQNFFFEDCHAALLGQAPYHYHVFLIYMRGYGESEHIADTTPKDYVKVWGEDVLAFADAMKIDKFFYTGVSHGCFAGWYALFQHPERLRAFVPTSGIARFLLPREEDKPLRLQEHNWDEIVGNREALDKMAWTEPGEVTDPERLQIRKNRHAEHLEILMGRKKEEFTLRNTEMNGSGATSQEEFHQMLCRVCTPVMIINGIKDPLSKVEEALSVTKLIPNSRLLTYEALGHGGPDEYPAWIARDCDRFFREVMMGEK